MGENIVGGNFMANRGEAAILWSEYRASLVGGVYDDGVIGFDIANEVAGLGGESGRNI